MQEFAANVWPELMRQIHAGIAQESEADARANRPHSLTLAGNIKISDGACSGDAENPRRVEGLAAAISTGNQHAAHGVQRALKKRQIRIAKIPGVLLEYRRKKKALEENVSLIGGQIDAVCLAYAANASLIFPVQMFAFSPVGGFVNGCIGESARRVSAVQKDIELLPCGERLPFSNGRIRFSVDGVIHLQLDHVLHLLKPGWRQQQQRSFRHGNDAGRICGVGNHGLRGRKTSDED